MNLSRASVVCLTLAAGLAWGAEIASAAVQFGRVQMDTNREALLPLSAPAGQLFRLEASTNLVDWTGLATLMGAASVAYTDSATPFLTQRFYRASEEAAGVVRGDHIATTDGELTVHPVEHATFVMTWQGKVIYCDPVGATTLFAGLPKADLILVTHAHGDHFNASTINAVRGTNAVIVAPMVVYQGLSSTLRAITTVLTNGATTNVFDVAIEAVPAYNLTTSHHVKGVGNGYVLTVGGKRIYVSGDTEDIPEMRALQDIDVAFVCMNLPFTMSVDKAIDAVREFRPKIVYVYHYRPNTPAEVQRFKHSVGTDQGTEVRLRDWY